MEEHLFLEICDASFLVDKDPLEGLNLFQLLGDNLVQLIDLAICSLLLLDLLRLVALCKQVHVFILVLKQPIDSGELQLYLIEFKLAAL